MLRNDPQPNKLCNSACIQSAFSVDAGGRGGGGFLICLTIFDDMLVIDVIDKMLHGTQYTYQLIAF